MIVAQRKPLQSIKAMLDGHRKVLAVGCGTCVTVCFAGGARETGILASALRMARALDGAPLEVDEVTVQRQCEDEFIAPLGDRLDDCDAVLALGCGVGVQTLAERFPAMRVLPALDTAFMGAPTAPGVWEERCRGCGDCLLDLTGGICPIARCAKQLLNGPCGGSRDGKCEVDPATPCAWQQIWERAAALGLIDRLLEVQPPRAWAARRRVVRDDLRVPEAAES